MNFWKKRKRLIITVTLVLILLVNLLAWMHARSLLQFGAPGTETTKKPEHLSLMEKIGVLLTGVRIAKPSNRATPKDLSLDYETHCFPGYNGHTLETWYIPHPSPRHMVLLFHGHAEAKGSLLPQAAAFNRMECSVLLVDFYGSGGSSGSRCTVGFNEAHDVTAAFNFARKQWAHRSIILYGFSMGSAALLKAIAQERLEPAAIIIEATFNRFMATTKNRFDEMGLPTFPAAQLLLFWGGVQGGFNAFKHNPEDYAQSVTCPALVLHGALDNRATLAEARQVFDKLGGEKYFKSYPRAGHQLLISVQPGKWRKDVEEFLMRVMEKAGASILQFLEKGHHIDVGDHSTS